MENTEISQYERTRLENIAKNQELLKTLGLQAASSAPPIRKSVDGQKQKKRKIEATRIEPTRKSARLSGQDNISHEELSAASIISTPTRPILKNLPRSEIPEALPEDYDPSYRAPLPTRDSSSTLQFEGYPHFTPNMTPSEMFQNGSFGGTFFRPFNSRILHQHVEADYQEFPDKWFEGLDPSTYLTSSEYDPSINFYGVKAGQSLEDWENSGWIRAQDPRGWAQWYARFYLGRRSSDDDRQIKRWIGVCGPNGRFKKSLVKKIAGEGEQSWDDKEISPILRQTLQHWGYRLTLDDYRAYL